MLLSTRFITRLNIEIQGIEHCTKKRSKNSVTKNLSFSTTTLIGKSQGGDFVFEAKVKQQLLLAPKVQSKLKHGIHCQECLNLSMMHSVMFP